MKLTTGTLDEQQWHKQQNRNSFKRQGPGTFFPPHLFSFAFDYRSESLLVAWGIPRLYRMAHQHMSLPKGLLCISAWSEMHGRQAVTLGELVRASRGWNQGPVPSSAIEYHNWHPVVLRAGSGRQVGLTWIYGREVKWKLEKPRKMLSCLKYCLTWPVWLWASHGLGMHIPGRMHIPLQARQQHPECHEGSEWNPGPIIRL